MVIVYLKILLLCLLAVYSNVVIKVEGAAVSKYAHTISKKLSLTRSLPFEDCGSQYLILYLSISSCSSIPCVMILGSTVEVNVLFDDNGKDTSFLKQKVSWIFKSIKTNAHITPDPCDGVQQCLQNDSNSKSYWSIVLVNTTLPVISGTMLWEAIDEFNRNVICFKVPVVIQNYK